MSVTAENLRTALAILPDAERPELAHFLIQSLESGVDEDAETVWDAELESRADEIKNQRASGEPAGKVFSELRAKYM